MECGLGKLWSGKKNWISVRGSSRSPLVVLLVKLLILHVNFSVVLTNFKSLG